MDSLITDLFLLGFYVLVFIAGILTIVKQRTTTTLFLGTCFAAAFIAGVAMNNPVLLIIGFASVVASTQITKAFAPYHLLWILLFLLKTTEWLTFMINN